MHQIDNKQNNIPALRFSEYRGDWVEEKLGEFFSFKNGINADKSQYGSGCKFINVLDIIANHVITYDSIIGSVLISGQEFKKNEVVFGDILFQRSSETREEVGQSNIYLDKKQSATFGGFVIRGHPIKILNSEYFNFLLKTSKARKDVTSRSGGSTRYNIGQESLSAVLVDASTFQKEQQKIASFLSGVDKKLSQLSQKKKLLEQYKKGMMQKIFSQQIRFKDDGGNDFPDWEEKKLGDVGNIVTGTTPPTSIKSFYGGSFPWITPTDIKDSKNILVSAKSLSEEGLKVGRFVPKNSLLVTCIASIGKNAILRADGSCNQQINAIVPNDNYDVDFLYYIIEKNCYLLESFAGSGAMRMLNKNDFSLIRIIFPFIEEQTKIANFLSSIDEKINLIETELTSAKTFKKGLLQQMFI